jgi:hypothetical protein
MATTNSPGLKNYKGSIQKVLVVKQYASKTILTSYPDRKRVIYSENQKAYQSRFAEAVAYARSIISDPVKKAEYTKCLPKGKRLFNAAVQEYLSPQSVPFSTIRPAKKKKGRIVESNIVIKNYAGKLVITSRPDMSR